MRKNNLLQISGLVFAFIFIFSKITFADTWTENATQIYTTDTYKKVGIGTINPTNEFHALSDQGTADPFIFEGYTGAQNENNLE